MNDKHIVILYKSHVKICFQIGKYVRFRNSLKPILNDSTVLNLIRKKENRGNKINSHSFKLSFHGKQGPSQ